MRLVRANLIVLTVGGVLALVPAGCITPWSQQPSTADMARSTNASVTTPSTPATTTDQANPAAAPPDMSSVLDKIQQVRALDPAAEPKLLEELRRVPASSWPLVAEQFRASLAYSQQLTEKNQTSSRDAQPVVDLRRTDATTVAADRDSNVLAASDLAYERGALSNEDRPSAPIGSLVDPHRASKESESALARTAPYSKQNPVTDITVTEPEVPRPARFTSDGPAYPIAEDAGTTADNAIVRDLEEKRRHTATQALAQSSLVSNTRQAAAEELAAPVKAIRLPDTQMAATDENWQQLVQKAIADLDKRVSRSPTTTAEVHQHVSLRMLQLLAGDTENALEPIPHISPTEQDYWSRQLFALATYLDHHSQPDDKRRASASVTHLEEAVSNMRELGSLALRNLSFCKNVYGYGAFDTYDADVFTPGQQVSLYVEVENYHSTSTDKGFTTSLGTTYEVLDDYGKRVASGDFPDVNDCCRSRRRDFHIQLGLTLPQTMTPGRYQLQLVVKDRQSDKIGNAKAPFEIRGGKK
jgi:hypothetical protein